VNETVWETSQSIETRASAEFAWRYWTEVKNWDDPPARFEFSGPFVAGARGLTHLPGQPPIEWIVREVKPGTAATVEIPVAGAAMRFEWRFEPVGEGMTLLTQRIVLHGESAANYLAYAKTLEDNLPHAMKKMASAIERALAETHKRQS
jgi:Polyketide cyclase / dehydrase and lipid transport